MCDSCNYSVVHYECLGWEEVPEEDWYCDRCEAKRARKWDLKFVPDSKKWKVEVLQGRSRS